MRRTVFGILVVLGIAFAVVPAAQAVNVPGCFSEEFLFFVKNQTFFEASQAARTDLTGNFFSGGEVRVLANNRVRGTIAANKITIGNGALVDKCITNTLVLQGTGACTDVSQVGAGQFNPPAACDFTAAGVPGASPPLTIPVIPNCVKTGADVTVPAGPTVNIPSGSCFRKLTIANGANVTFGPGSLGAINVGTFKFVGNNTGTGTGGDADKSIINTPGEFTTGSGTVALHALFITSLAKTGHAIDIFNNSLVDNTLLFAPFGNCHPHTGSQLSGDTEFVCDRVQFIQPITNTPPPPTEFCPCPNGFKFENGPPATWTEDTRNARTCND